MKNIIYLIVLLSVLTSCSGAKAVSGHGYRIITIYQVGTLKPTSMYSILEKCDRTRKKCKRIAVNHSQQTGVVSGLTGPMIYGASIATAGKFIGKGISEADFKVNIGTP